MARFLLSAMPFTGHVSPVRAVAEALSARGHDVRFYTGRAFERGVEASGARFVPWSHARDFDENDLTVTFPRLIGKKGISQLLVNVADLFIGTAPGQFADLTAEWEREPWDVLAADEMSVGSAFFAEHTGVPWATAAVLPLNMMGPQGPPTGMGIVPGRNPVTRVRDALLRAVVPLMTGQITKPLARARAEVGLPPSRRPFGESVFSTQLVTVGGCPALDYGRTDRPDWVHFVGRISLAASPAADGDRLPSWWGDLEGRTVVHVTQGTQNIDPSDLLRPAIEALADRDVLVVAATGVPGNDTLPFTVPGNVRVAGFLPYEQLLPRVDVMITNGGWGGTLAALSHGIPLVIAGGDLDKPEIASLVAWAGAGVNLKSGTPSAAKVATGVDRVMSGSGYRDAAARVSAQLASLGGAPRAAELIEQLAVP
ncbi:glycosyltransferase [Microbacterium sp. NPDC056569]|uniref:glycosyltransferase n=1 Tax=Microbacterium sp. NPDC056569 TaxID=3345867 RepID=UPI00366AADB1